MIWYILDFIASAIYYVWRRRCCVSWTVYQKPITYQQLEVVITIVVEVIISYVVIVVVVVLLSHLHRPQILIVSVTLYTYTLFLFSSYTIILLCTQKCFSTKFMIFLLKRIFLMKFLKTTKTFLSVSKCVLDVLQVL